MKKLLIIFFLSLVGLQFFQTAASAYTEDIVKYKAYILDVNVEECNNGLQCYNYELEIQERDLEGEIVSSSINSYEGLDPSIFNYNKGDLVYVQKIGPQDDFQFIIIGPVREFPLLLLSVVFIVITVAIGRFNGLGAIVGLGASMFALFGVVSPMILNGGSPIVAAYLGGVIILTTSVFFSHGVNKKTLIAILSSFIGLFIISIFAVIFLELFKLTGLGADNALEIITESSKALDMKGILYASIIIGGVGVLDDITVNQVSVLQQIYLTDKNQSVKELYEKAMNVGRDHIASLVNTLFIAYASASLPIIMLLQATSSSFNDIINSDIFAEEIVRAVVGSLGLILIVPISSYIAAWMIKKYKGLGFKNEEKSVIVHAH